MANGIIRDLAFQLFDKLGSFRPSPMMLISDRKGSKKISTASVSFALMVDLAAVHKFIS